MGIPMLHKQTLLGSLCFCRNESDQRYSAQDMEVGRLFVSHAAVATQNARLSEQIQDLAVLQERDRIAREMHDGMAQVLGYINAQTIGVKKLLDNEKLAVARDELSKMKNVAKELYVDVREGIVGLRVAAQPDKGLVPVPREYVEHYREISGMAAETRVSPAVEDLEIPATDEVQLLRIVQEALTNVRKHSGATSVSVNLEHANGQLSVNVNDNGVGFDPHDLPASGGPQFGLRVMEERVQSLGGRFSIQPNPAGGTTVSVLVPLTRRRSMKVAA